MLSGIQLEMDGAWSWVSFGAWPPAAALAEMVVLWLAVLATTVSFAAGTVLDILESVDVNVVEEEDEDPVEAEAPAK